MQSFNQILCKREYLYLQMLRRAIILEGNVEDSLHLSFFRILRINDFFENFIQSFMRAEITLPSFKLSPLIVIIWSFFSKSLSITNHFFLLSFSLTIIISSSGLWLMCCLATAVTLVIEPWMTRSSLDGAPVLALRIQALKSDWRMHFTFDGQSHSPEL